LPEGSTAPPAEYAADLFWLLHQGHILLYTDDTLAVQEARETRALEAGEAPKKAKKKKKKSKKAKPPGEVTIDGESPATAVEAETPTEDLSEASPTPVAETPAVEPPSVIEAAAEEPASTEPEEELPHPFSD
jgi:hypothetical protein